MNSLKALIAQFQSGQMARMDFWRAMQENHLQLREYQELIAGSDVDSITIRGDELQIRTRTGISMVWNPEDMGTAPNVLMNHRFYDPMESRCLLEAAAGTHVIFDIGANVGYYTLHWAPHMATGGQIHAFEPVPSTFAWLSRNIAVNHLDDLIRANNFGLGAAPETMSIFVPAL